MDIEQFFYLIFFLWAIWFVLGKLGNMLTRHHKGIKERNAKEKITFTNGDTSIEMPRYISHKEVWALQIKSVVFDEREEFGILVFVNNQYENISLPKDYFLKHCPEAGGYYVVYKDGYRSYSPAEAFEDGNSLIGPNESVASYSFKSFTHELHQDPIVINAWCKSITDYVKESGGTEEVAAGTVNLFMKQVFNIEVLTKNDKLSTPKI